MHALRLLTIVGAALAVAVPAAQGAGPTRPGTSQANGLWYRLSVDVKGTYHLDYGNGDQDDEANGWSLHSNTAVLVKRHCVVEGLRLDTRTMGLVAGLPNNYSCDDLRQAVRGTINDNPQFLSHLHDDLTVRANAQGTAAKWSATLTRAPHIERHNGKDVRCPGGVIEKKLDSPAAVVGVIAGSARFGISAGFSLRDGPYVKGAETRRFAECRDPDTGELVYGPSNGSSTPPLFAEALNGLYAPTYGSTTAGGEFGGALSLNAVRIGNSARRFGQSFTLDGVQPGTHQAGPNSSTKRVSYHFQFSLCPNGGRDVQGC